MDTPEHKFRSGDFVVSKESPLRRLMIRRFLDRIYYCIDQAIPNGADLVFFERELMADPQTATQAVAWTWIRS